MALFISQSRLKQFWNGKSIFLTGASSGLGRAVVEALAPFQLHFGLASRRQELLKELAHALRNTGSRFSIFPIDVRNRESVYQALQTFSGEVGQLDVAWINSGVGARSSVNTWEWDQIEAVIDTNIKGALYTLRASVEIMARQTSGTIVAIGSVASARGMPAHGVYSASKIALTYFVEGLAPLLPHIQFTIIHPGYVDTPMTSGNPRRYFMLTPEAAARRMIRAVAAGRRVYIFPFPMKLVYHFLRLLPTGMYYRLAGGIR